MKSNGWTDLAGATVKLKTFTVEKGSSVHFVNANATTGSQVQWPASSGNGNNQYPDSSASFCRNPAYDTRNLNACVINGGIGGLNPGQVYTFKFDHKSATNNHWTIIDRLFYGDTQFNNHQKYELRLKVVDPS